MTDEPVDTSSKSTVLSGDSEPDEDHVKVKFYVDVRLPVIAITIDDLAFLTAASIYSKAFLEALARRHADGVADLVRTRVRRKGKPAETRIGVDDGSAATIAITEDTPDEARLALLDLDVTADAVRGKLLRWDHSTSAWRPDPDE